MSPADPTGDMADSTGISPLLAAKQRNPGMWRPIEPHERPYLQAFAAELRRMRVGADLTQRRMASLASLSARQIQHLEAGDSRTRRSTIVRLVWAAGEGPEKVDELVRMLGPTIAQESRTSSRGALKRYAKRRQFDDAVRRAVMAELERRARARRNW